MFPWVYEFRWTAGHIIFLGLFFSVVMVIAATVAAAAIRSIRDVRKRKDDAIMWHADFEDLPPQLRACRHEFTGEVKERTCHNGFDCRSCATHPILQAMRPQTSPATGGTMFGLTMPSDRMYHRGHSWVEKQPDGTYTVGLDDFAGRLTGTPTRVVLPEPGTRLSVNGKGWLMERQGITMRILSPVDGVVVEQGGHDLGWYLRVRPEIPDAPLDHLLRGAEVRPWTMKELERIQVAMGSGGAVGSLADGGELVKDVVQQAPGMDWDAVWGETFLEG